MRLAVISSIDAAVDLYNDAKRMPGTITKASVFDTLGIRINGPIVEGHPHILSAASSSGMALAVKILDSSCAAAEVEACQKLCLGGYDAPPSEVYLLNCSSTTLNHVDSQESNILNRAPGSYQALVMPRYATTVAELPQLTETAIVAGILRLKTAVDYVHSKGLVHMDVKAANVFVDSVGGWVLGDFGSCVSNGKPVRSCTYMFHPAGKKLLASDAIVSFDVDFLLILLIMELNKEDDAWKPKLFDSTSKRVLAENIRAECNRTYALVDGVDVVHKLAQELLLGVSRLFC